MSQPIQQDNDLAGTPNPVQPTDRVPAAVGHLGILVLPGVGFAIPLLLRGSERNASGWLDRQLLQAVAWNVLQPVYFLLVILAEGLGLVGVLALLAALPDGLIPERIYGTLSGAAGIFSLLGLAYSLAALWGAVACLLGKDFDYPWIGAWMRRYLQEGEHGEDQTARLLAAMAHAAILIPLTGMLLPLWNLLQRAGRTAWSRFQALQTLVYQGVGVVVGVLLIASGWLAVLPALFSAGEITAAFQVETLSFQQFLVFIPLFIYMLLAGAALFLAPLYQTLGLVAAVSVLRGRQYRYPIVGRWVDRLDRRAIIES